MLTIPEIIAAGGQVVAGRVVKDKKFIAGVWAEGKFAPAPGESLVAPAAVSPRGKMSKAAVLLDPLEMEGVIK